MVSGSSTAADKHGGKHGPRRDKISFFGVSYIVKLVCCASDTTCSSNIETLLGASKGTGRVDPGELIRGRVYLGAS